MVWDQHYSIQTVAPVSGAEAVTLAEVRSQVQLPASYTSEDTLLQRLVNTAMDVIEKETSSAILTQAREVKFDCFPSWEIVLDYPPLQSVSSIVYVDANGSSQTLSSSLYTVVTEDKPGYITPAYGTTWPIVRGHTNDVTITYVAGYGTATTDVPESIRHAILLMVTDAYRNRMPYCEGSDKIFGLLDYYNFRDQTVAII